MVEEILRKKIKGILYKSKEGNKNKNKQEPKSIVVFVNNNTLEHLIQKENVFCSLFSINNGRKHRENNIYLRYSTNKNNLTNYGVGECELKSHKKIIELSTFVIDKLKEEGDTIGLIYNKLGDRILFVNYELSPQQYKQERKILDIN